MKAVMKMKGASTAAAGFGRLTAKDKIIIGLANGTFNIADFSIMWGKYNAATNVAIDSIWNKIYERYIMQTDVEQDLIKQIAADYKKINGNNISINNISKNNISKNKMINRSNVCISRWMESRIRR